MPDLLPNSTRQVLCLRVCGCSHLDALSKSLSLYGSASVEVVGCWAYNLSSMIGNCKAIIQRSHQALANAIPHHIDLSGQYGPQPCRNCNSKLSVCLPVVAVAVIVSAATPIVAVAERVTDDIGNNAALLQLAAISVVAVIVSIVAIVVSVVAVIVSIVPIVVAAIVVAAAVAPACKNCAW